jgi:hypothetical protein
LYQHYASLYRMPMLNGYNPAGPKRYAEDVYPAVSPVNRGLLGPAEMDVFRDMGITRVILHENAFPEKVSPFPGCFTLRRLLQNPGLRLTASSGGVWAFETGDVAAGASVAVPEWRIYCPGRIWTAPQGRGENVEPVPAADSEGGECLRMAEPPASVSFPGARAVFEPGLRLMFRLRGAGEAGARLFLDGRLCADEAIRVGSDEWAWHEVSVPPFDGQAMIKAAVGLTAGRVDVDSLILAAGEWRNPEGSAPVRIPAPCLFHFGETDLSSNSIILRRDAVASLEAIYGPCMPLDPGEYTVEMKYSSPAPAGVRLGSLALRRGGVNLAESQVEAGRPAVLALNLRDNRSVAVYFLFGWSADVEVLEFVISRGGGDHATGLSEDRAAAD